MTETKAAGCGSGRPLIVRRTKEIIHVSDTERYCGTLFVQDAQGRSWHPAQLDDVPEEMLPDRKTAVTA